MSLRAVIVDDEPLALARLEIGLARIGGVEVTGSASNGTEALDLVRRLKPDLLFLDIQMPGLSGLQAARALPDDAPPIVVFVTAFDRFACEAFDCAAVDYILKPFAFERLKEAVTRANATFEQRQARAQLERLHRVLDQLERDRRAEPADLWVARRGETIRLAPSEIHWLQAERDYVRIHTSTGDYLQRASLQKLCEALGECFVRVHRSAAVNLDHVAQATDRPDTGATVVLASGARAPIGRSYLKDWRRRTQGARLRRPTGASALPAQGGSGDRRET